MKFSCIIVDENAAVLQTFQEYAAVLPGIDLLAGFSDMLAAGEFLKSNTVDVLFTDIAAQGFIHLHSNSFMQPPPALVFMTDDAAKAMVGFDLDAVDCLAKPLTFERFVKTVGKIQRRLSPIGTKENVNAAPQGPQYFFVKSEQNFIKVEFSKIYYIEGLENYVRFCCENKTVLALSTMKSLEAILASYNFLRIHRSYLVNLDKVERVLDYDFYVGEKVLPVGRSYRKTIADTLKQSYTFGC